MTKIFKIVVRCLLLCVFAYLTTTNSRAASIELVSNRQQSDIHRPCDIHLEGAILPGDAAKFSEVFPEAFKRVLEEDNNIWGVTLCLDSPGGNFLESLAIAREMLSINASTYIPEGKECLSGCAFIFMAGSFRGSNFNVPIRYMHPTAKLGFHSPFLRPDLLPNDTLSRSDIIDSYQAALVAIHQIVDLFVRTEHIREEYERPLWFKPSLLREALTKGANEFFFVDSIGKVGNFGIKLIGVHEYKQEIKRKVRNACRNIYAWKVDYYDYLDFVHAVVFDSDVFGDQHYFSLSTVPTHIREEIETKDSKSYYVEIQDGGSGGIKCIVQFRTEKPDSDYCRFDDQLDPNYDSSGDHIIVWLADSNFEKRESFCVKEWQTYPMDYPIGVEEWISEGKVKLE